MLDDVVLMILAARAIMLEDALDDRVVRTPSEEVLHPPLFRPRMSRFASRFHSLSYLTALGSVRESRAPA